ncbi:MAG: glutamine synthetase [Solirubrobacteraceae bacterium]|jgi:glutamine synthetase|nr:glutamine synthetase [Solirubrobacteraceae bacterium]
MSVTTSPIYAETQEEALPHPDRVAEVKASLEAAGVDFVLSCWVDLLGSPKTKPVPLREFENLCRGKGPEFAAHSVSMVPELGPSDPDQVPIPDLDSVMICPWDPRVAWVFGDLYTEEKPYNVDPRLVLKRQVKRAAEAGFHVYAGFEPEFIVCKEENGRIVKAFGEDELLIAGEALKRQPYGYDAEHSLDGLPFLRDVVAAMDALGWGLSNVVCEGAFSQFELDYHYSGAVEAADRFVFLRVMLKEIAKKHGFFVTYMPKPTNGDWRSGAHINHSFARIDDLTDNVFSGENGGWGDLIYPAVAGQMKHGEAITAVACQTVNSYKGLVGRVAGLEGGTLTWAPTHITYGYNNRSAMIRLPQRRRAIENRACDMAVNPHLALAMTTAASLAGIEQRLDAGQPMEKPLYDVTPAEQQERGIRRLPRTLIEAIEAFDADPLAKDVLGETMHGMFSQYKHDEWERFHQTVTEWDQKEYMKFF